MDRGSVADQVAIPYVCVRCGASAGDGVLFCGDCAPVETLQQDVAIRMTSFSTHEARVSAKARPEAGKKPARSVVVDDKWNYDRGRVERCTIYADRDDGLFIEVWQDRETGEVMFVKRGALRDQTIHGARTRRAQSGRQTPPPRD